MDRTPATLPTRTDEQGRTVVDANDPAVLLGLLPHLLGREPGHCLAVLLFRDRRTCGAMRHPLPPSDLGGADAKAWAAHVVGLACKVQGVTGVAVVITTPATFAPAGRVPHADLHRVLARRARQAGLEVKDSLTVAADGWGSIHDPHLPRGGRSLGAIATLDADDLGRPDPAADARARRLDRMPTGLPDVEAAGEDAAERFLGHLASWWRRPAGPGGTLHGVRLDGGAAFRRVDRRAAAMDRYRSGEEREDYVALLEAAIAPHDHSGDPCPCRALLYAVASRPGLPEILLTQIGWGPQRALRILSLAGHGLPDSPEHLLLHRGIGGLIRERPDPARIRDAIEALGETARYVPEDARGPLDAMLAWLWWALGSGSMGAAYAERGAETIEVRDLVDLIAARAGRGELPEWAFGEGEREEDALLPPAA